MATLVLAEVPYTDVTASIAGDELALVRMNDNIIDWNAVGVVSLDVTSTCIPDFDCP